MSTVEDNLEHKSLVAGSDRIKFQCKWVDPISTLYDKYPHLESKLQQLQTDMADAMCELEAVGVTPELPDGKVGGNAAVYFSAGQDQLLLVSKSGKLAHHRLKNDDFCVVTCFDEDRWSCEYLACNDSVMPTSDTPLYHCILNAHTKLDWTEKPIAALHGHALETEEKAKRCGLPISDKETLFSTPEDSKALFLLVEEYPYPEHKVFVRKGHGFFLMGSSLTEALKTFNQDISPVILELAKEKTRRK